MLYSLSLTQCRVLYSPTLYYSVVSMASSTRRERVKSGSPDINKIDTKGDVVLTCGLDKKLIATDINSGSVRSVLTQY